MTKILTLAIPVYNMEKYLSRCLDSVVSAKNAKDIEALVINDGSKDGSLAIAREYEKKFPETIIVIDKPNGGWGSAINLAMGKASGKYFKILDSDDWVNTSDFEELVELLKTINVDILATSYTKIFDNEPNIEVLFDNDICGNVLSYNQRLIDLNYNTDIPMATLCYKTELLKRIELKVAEKYYADIQFSLIPFVNANTIYYSRLNIYQYYLGRVGQSTSIDGYNSHYIDFINITKGLLNYYSENIITGAKQILLQREISKLIRFGYYLLMSPQFRGNTKDGKDALVEYDNFIKRNHPLFYKQLSKEMVRGFIPFIKIWRVTGINVLNIRKWI